MVAGKLIEHGGKVLCQSMDESECFVRDGGSGWKVYVASLESIPNSSDVETQIIAFLGQAPKCEIRVFFSRLKLKVDIWTSTLSQRFGTREQEIMVLSGLPSSTGSAEKTPPKACPAVLPNLFDALFLNFSIWLRFQT